MLTAIRLLMRDNTAAPSVKTEDTISRRLVRNSASIPSIKTEDTHAVASSPSLACSNQQTIGTPMTAYQESQLDSPLISNFCNLALDEVRPIPKISVLYYLEHSEIC